MSFSSDLFMGGADVVPLTIVNPVCQTTDSDSNRSMQNTLHAFSVADIDIFLFFFVVLQVFFVNVSAELRS